MKNSAEPPPPPRWSAHTGLKAALGQWPDVGRATPKVGSCFSFPSWFHIAFPFLPPPVHGGGEWKGGKRRACSQGGRKPSQKPLNSHICFQQTFECQTHFDTQPIAEGDNTNAKKSFSLPTHAPKHKARGARVGRGSAAQAEPGGHAAAAAASPPSC